MRHSKRPLSLILAILLVLTTGISTIITAFADGNEAKIGDKEYATLNAAIDAAQDGDTITLLRDLTWTNYNKEIKKTVTIDGTEAKYKITATAGYTFAFYQSFTLKNLKFDTTHGFRFRNTVGKDAVGTVENVDWTLGAGLLVNIQGENAAVPQTFNVINSTITKKAIVGDPILATYNVAGMNVTINIENSTLTQNGGKTNGEVGNRSAFYFNPDSAVALNLKGNSVINYNPMGQANGVNGMFITNQAKVTANIEATVQLNLLGTQAVTPKNYFVHKIGSGSITVNDAGATWNVSKRIATLGYYLPAGSYNVNNTGKAVIGNDVICYGNANEDLSYRKAEATYTEADLNGDADHAYSGYGFKVSAGYYRTLANALAANGEITMIADTLITSKITLAKDVVIDGQGKYVLNANTYFFALNGHQATFRNLTLNVTHGVRTDDVAGANVLFENCQANVTGGLLINFNRNANVTFTNTTVISTAGDPVILLQAGAVSEIDLVNSTIDYRKGSSGDNTSIINIAGKSNGTVTVDETSKLIYNPNSTGTANQLISVHDVGTVGNITLKAGARLEYNTVPASITSLAFIRNSNATLNLVDEGATWKVSEAVAKKGYRFINSAGDSSTLNCKTVAMRTSDGALYSPTEVINLTAETSFVPVAMGVSNTTGASIRLSLPTGIRFETAIDKAFYETMGTSAVYGVKVARKDVLAGGKFAALSGEQSVSYTTEREGFRWVTEGEAFHTVLTNIAEENYTAELAWTAFVTVTYADGKTATYWADYSEAGNCRSLAQVAKSALNDETVTWTAEETAILKTIAGIQE